MYRQGPLRVGAHELIDPLLAVLLIAAPFLFSFSDVGPPTALGIVAGLAVLVLAMSTDWRLSLVKVVPLPVHAAIDTLLAVVLIASPFLFTFQHRSSAATAFFIVIGIAGLLLTLGTRWSGGRDPHDAARGWRRTKPSPDPTA